MTEYKLKALYQESLLKKVEKRGAIVPASLLAVVLLFTSADYLLLGLDSILIRLLVIIPLIASLIAYSLKASPRILHFIQNSWLIGGNLMLAGLCFLVFTEHSDNLVLKYGTILGYSIVIYLSILVSYESSILWIIILPLLLSTISIYLFVGLLEWVLFLNLYSIVIVGFILVKNQQGREFSLFQDRLRIKELNKQLEDFAHITSHDLRSPLGSISTHLDIIERRISQGEYERAIRSFSIIKSSVKHMDKLLEDILSYSKISTKTHEKSWVCTKGILKEVQDNLAEVIEESQAEISVGDMPNIQGSKTRLYQIFQNLLLNALKYADSSNAPVVLIESFPDGNELVIAFHDNGLGVPQYMADRIFNPFERYHIGEAGSGLGLSMVKKHMELYGGKVSLESTEGVGSSFFLHFPKHLTK